ncbi:MAG: hypothetical protein CBD91_01100 [Phycisphaeraceae bacterium TMED231]|nr:MAG: hypothetical protein CBD91_01100 [Phycisphaeraceae bacterium TMED231]
MAKQKLNVKFLAVLLGVAAVVIVSISAWLLVSLRNDPLRHISKGDALMAEGKYDAAAKQYFRANGKDPYPSADYRPYEKAIAAINSISPETDVAAKSRFRQLVALQLQKARYSTDPAIAAEREAGVRNALLPMLHVLGSIDKPSIQPMLGTGLAPDIEATLLALSLQPEWRNAENETPKQWADLRGRIEKVIEIDPSLVMTHYGLIRGELEQGFNEDIPTKAIDRVSEPIDALLAEARESAGDAVEFDAIAQERAHRRFLLPLDRREAERRAIATPDPEVIRGLAARIAESTPVDADRPSLLRIMDIADAGRRRPNIGSRAPEVTEDTNRAWAELLVAALAASNAIDPTELQSTRHELVRLELAPGLVPLDGTPEELQARFSEIFAARDALAENILSLERGFQGGSRAEDGSFADYSVREVVLDDVQKEARRARLQVAMRRWELENQAFETMEEKQAAFQAIVDAFEVYSDAATTEDNLVEADTFALQMDVLRARMLMNASRKGEAGAAYARAVSAYNRLSEAGMEGMLERTQLQMVIEALSNSGERGALVGLKMRARQRFPDLAEKHVFLLSLAADLLLAGRIEEARIEAEAGLAIARANEDEESVKKADMILRDVATSQRSAVATEIPGADLLARDDVARVSNDIVERRRILQSIVDAPESAPIDRIVRVQALKRLIAIEDLGGFEAEDAATADAGMVTSKELARKLLEYVPDDPLARMVVESQGFDRIERSRVLARVMIEEQEGEDYASVELDATVAEMLSKYLDQTEISSGVSGSMSARIRDQRQAVAEEEARLHESISNSSEPRSPRVVRYLIRESVNVRRRDLDQATALLADLKSLEGDSAYLGQMQIVIAKERGDDEAALLLAEEVCGARGLGTPENRYVYAALLLQKGDRETAIQQLKLANAQNPTIVRVANALARVLAESGDTDQALDVYRRTALAGGRSDSSFREAWFRAEQAFPGGDPGRILKERRRIFQLAPANYSNAINLVQLLKELPVSRADILVEALNPNTREPEMRPEFGEREWSRLSPAKRQDAIRKLKLERIDEADKVLDRLLRYDDTDPTIVIAISRYLRASGNPEEAYQTLDDAVARIRASGEDYSGRNVDRESLLLVEQGRLIWDSDRNRALEKFHEAEAAQKSGSNQATALIIGILRDRNSTQDVIGFSERLFENVKAQNLDSTVIRFVARDLINDYLRAFEVEKGRSLIEEFVDQEDPNYPEQLLLGQLAVTEAAAIRRSTGSFEAMEPFLDEAEAFAAAASQLTKSNGAAQQLWGDALALRAESNPDPDASRVAFDAAVMHFGEAINLDNTSWEKRRALVILLARNFRYELASAELESFIAVRNDVPEASILLSDLLDRQLGLDAKALTVLQAAIARQPTNIRLMSRIAALRADRLEYDRAAEIFAEAFELTSNASLLKQEVLMRMRRVPADAATVVRLPDRTSEHKRVFMSDPGLAAAYAAAVERQAARKGLGLKQIESIRQQYVTIADQKIEGAGDDEEDLAQAKAVKAYYLQQIAFWYRWIFGTQVTGVGDSDNAEFRFELAQAEAMDAWVRGVSGGNPSLPELLRVASAWQIAGDEERCMEVLEEAMANPEATEQGRYAAMVQLGYVMLRSDDPDCERAISIFEQASALRPSEPTVKNNLAYAIASCDGDLEVALPLSLDVVASEPDNAAYRDTLGEIYWRMHEEAEAGALEGWNTADLLAKAAQEFRNALEINPIKVQSWIHLAKVHLVRDECGEARTALKKAGDSDPALSEQSQIDRLMTALGECGK